MSAAPSNCGAGMAKTPASVSSAYDADVEAITDATPRPPYAASRSGMHTTSMPKLTSPGFPRATDSACASGRPSATASATWYAATRVTSAMANAETMSRSRVPCTAVAVVSSQPMARPAPRETRSAVSVEGFMNELYAFPRLSWARGNEGSGWCNDRHFEPSVIPSEVEESELATA